LHDLRTKLKFLALTLALKAKVLGCDLDLGLGLEGHVLGLDPGPEDRSSALSAETNC